MGVANLVKMDEIIGLSITPDIFFGIQRLFRCLTIIATRRRICSPLEWDNRTVMMELVDKIRATSSLRMKRTLLTSTKEKKESSLDVI